MKKKASQTAGRKASHQKRRGANQVSATGAGSVCHTAAALTAMIVAHGAPASAQAPSPSPASPPTGKTPAAQLPEVVVRGQQEPAFKPESFSSPRYTEPLRDVPQTITVVPQAVIESRGASTLREVLRNVPGISMQAGEGGGGLPGDNLSIRGFNARSDIFVDGVRDFGAYSRDAFNLEQVEVSKGPTSATTGRGSTGGSINLVSKAPQLERSYGGSFGLGTDDYKRLTADFNQPIEDLGLKGAAFRLNGMWHDAAMPGRDVVEDSRWAIAPSLAFGLATPTRVTLSYLHMEQDNVPDYGLPWVPAGNTNATLARYINRAPPVNFDNFYGLEDYDFEDVIGRMATLQVVHDFTPAVSLRNTSRYARTYRNSAITAPRFLDLNPGTPVESDRFILRQLQRRELDHHLLANVTDAKLEFPTGPLTHAVVGGFEVTHEDQDNRNSAQSTGQLVTDVFRPNPQDPRLAVMPPITGVPNEATALTLAPYVFDTVKVGERWQFNGGLRLDHVESDYESGTLRLARTDNLLSWRAGMVFKPRPNGSVYFGYGTSFNPSIEGNTGLALATNTVNLNPEETRTYELGTKWDLLRERLTLLGAIFRTEKFDARTAGINPGDPSIVLDGKQVVHGVEFFVSGNVTKEWSVIAGYTYLTTEIESSNSPGESGAEFSNAPEHSASLWTTYALPWDLEIGAGTQYVGERLNNLSSNANVRRAPDYWLFDAMLSYAATRHLTLRLNLYNLGDERYIDRVGGGHFVPGPGRSAVLTASLKF